MKLPAVIARYFHGPARSRPLREFPIIGGPVRAFEFRLTPRGRYLFVALVVFAVLGVDTRARLIYALFSMAAGLYVAATIFGFRPRPKATLHCRIPERATVGRTLRLRRTDPLGLLTTAPVVAPDSPLLVYPRFYTMESFDIPLGRRYQPGGIPLTSSTGDAIEFIGTREYRPGDAVRNIHWRSWARRGAPVVKEYQEEYFCRIAIILDTFLTKAASDAGMAGFESAISMVASIADYFSRSEYVVDILAAGPDVYEVSSGRSRRRRKHSEVRGVFPEGTRFRRRDTRRLDRHGRRDDLLRLTGSGMAPIPQRPGGDRRR